MTANPDEALGISGSDWIKGIALSILASIIGGASKLSIRKSWLMVERLPELNSSHLMPLLGFEKDCIINEISGVSKLPESSNVDSSGDQSKYDCETKLRIDLSQYQKQIPVDQSQHLGGDIFQKSIKSNLNEQYPNSNFFRTHRRSLILRLSGMCGMSFLNPLCCIWAMVYASPSVLAPFSGLTLVWIVLLSEFFINERPLSNQILAAALIIIGEIITAIMGDHTNNDTLSLEEIQQSYRDPKFIGYFIGISVWMLCLIIFIKYGSPTLQRFAWGVSGGSITGLQNFLKDGLTIINITSSNESYPVDFYIYVVGGIFTAFTGLLLLTACMKRYDAAYSSSMFVGSFVISASIMAAVHYNTFQNLEGIWNFFFYPFGLLILLSGVILLGFSSDSQYLMNLQSI